MNIWKSLGGVIQAELVSADIDTSLNALYSAGIALYNVEKKDEFTTIFQIRRVNWNKLNALAQKRGDQLKIRKQSGAFYQFRSLIHRPVITAGAFILIFALFFLPTRVLFVRTEGNAAISSQKIIEAGARCGITFGASRRNVRSEKVKNALLAELPELQWAGVNTKGCVAIISVGEKTESESEPATGYISSIVAKRDGIILSCSATEGNLLCTEGQAVQKGQLLISGYTDCGLCIRVSGAEGEILAQTERKLTVIKPSQSLSKGIIQNQRKKYSLLIGKKRINLWKDSGIWDATCDRMYEEYYVTLPGGYSLPVGIAVDSGSVRQLHLTEDDPESQKSAIAEYTKYYLHQHMVAGNLISSSENMDISEGLIQMNGEYTCTEMIGKVQREQIGEDNGKNDGTDR